MTTTKATFTPGPWFVHNGEDCLERDITNHADSSALAYFVATAWGGGDPEALLEANARLIAAAPDLLEALLNVRAAFTPEAYSLNIWQRTALEMARAAIAKAEGDE